MEQWKQFEPWLGPLRQALGDALTAYRDPPGAAVQGAGADQAAARPMVINP
jgi:hypothetical protein